MNSQNNFYRGDKDLISLFLEEDVNYWAVKWGVSKETIKSAVKACGSNSVSNVYNYLERSRKIRFN